MLKNAYFLAKIGADTAENEQHFAEILPIGRRVADPTPARARGDRSGTGPGTSTLPCRKLRARSGHLRAVRAFQLDQSINASFGPKKMEEPKRTKSTASAWTFAFQNA